MSSASSFGFDEDNKPKTLKGKYQIKKNIYVTCYVDAQEANDKAFKTYLGLKKRYDALVPVGTKLYFNAESINKINARRSGVFDIFSVSVTEVEAQSNGRHLHICTPILRETHPDKRQQERPKTEFYLTHAETHASFVAINATLKGLKLVYKSKKAMLSLNLEQHCNFELNYKGSTYQLGGEIRYIQYDWKTHNHEIGIRLDKLSEEQEIILNRLIDPNYHLDISSKQTVDTAEGKISRDL